MAAAGAVALGAVGFAVLTWPAAPEPPPLEVLAGVPDRVVTVHVSGEVLRPGLVVLESEARVADAIAAAGGATSQADLGAVNLAASVGDGARLVVPSMATGAAMASDGVVHLNAATAEDLQTLPGVGPVLAGRIVAYREANGPFEVVEDLLGVPGIGEAKLGAIRDGVLVP